MLNFLKRLFTRKTKPSPALQKAVAEYAGVSKSISNFANIASAQYWGSADSPASWNVDRNEYAKHIKGPVYVASAAIAKRCAMQPVKCLAITRKKSGVRKEELDPLHPLCVLLEEINPHPSFVPFDLWFLTVAWRLTMGDSYWWKVRNNMGKPVELWPIPPQWCHVVPSQTKYIGSYRVNGGSFFYGSDDKFIAVEDMVHTRENSVDWSGTGRFYGTPPLAAAAEMVDIHEHMLKRLFYTFKNYAPPGLNYSTDEQLTDAQAEEALVWILAQHGRAEQTGRPIISHSGYKVTEYAKSQREMDYQSSLETSFDYILANFGVPSAIVGILKDANRANMEAAMMAFAQNTVNPILTSLGQHLTIQLARDFDRRIVIEFDPVTIADTEAIRKDWEFGMKSGAVTPNEVRQEFLRRDEFVHGGGLPVISRHMMEAPFGNEEPKPMSALVPPAAGGAPVAPQGNGKANGRLNGAFRTEAGR